MRNISDLKKNIVKGITSNEKTREIILAKRNKEFNLFSDVRKVFSIIIIFADSLFANSSYLRSYINDLIITQGGSIPLYNIMNINELEYIISIIESSSVSFSELLEAKEANDKWYTDDFKSFINEYADSKGISTPEFIPSILRNRWKQFYTILFGHPLENRP